MATRNGVLGIVAIGAVDVLPGGFLKGASAAVPITFSSGETWHLRHDRPNAGRLLEHVTRRYAAAQPVYVEADERSGEIKRLLFPSREQIRAVADRPIKGALAVNVTMAQSVHWLSKKHPQFSQVEKRLRAAATSHKTILLTFDPVSMEILDVTEAGSEPPGLAVEALTLQALQLVDVISEKRANDEFAYLAAQSYIPFNYPPNCCWSRAHEMCRSLALHGINSEKHWNFGSGWGDKPVATIKTKTPKWKKPFVKWTYHVAPIISVRKSTGAVVRRILDPSLFAKPVHIQTWLGVQKDPGKNRGLTKASFIYFFDPDDFPNSIVRDDDYSKTKAKFKEHIEARDSA